MVKHQREGYLRIAWLFNWNGLVDFSTKKHACMGQNIHVMVATLENAMLLDGTTISLERGGVLPWQKVQTALPQ